MNKKSWFGKDKDQLASKTLCLSDEYIITYAATHVAHIYDTDDVIDQLDETFITKDEVVMAVNEAIISVRLPEGLMLVGMSNTAPDSDKNLKYGFVDFSVLKNGGSDE